MARRAERLKKLLSRTKPLSNQAQSALLKAEDVLTGIEDREARRTARETQSSVRKPGY